VPKSALRYSPTRLLLNEPRAAAQLRKTLNNKLQYEAKRKRISLISLQLTLKFRPSDITHHRARQEMASTPRLRVPPKEPESSEERAMEDDASRPGSGEAGRSTLLSFDDMPQWFQHDNNKWILHGYRPISGSTRASFRSWWYLHNETVNIYSHLIPAVVFLFGEWYLLQYLASKYSRVNSTDFLVFSSFIITATTCYAFSALYHTLMNHSYTVDHFWHRLDMLGIGIFIVGDIILGVYLIFWCETTIRNIYWSMVSCPPYARLSCSRIGD
jgi:adiponectin receptor